MKNDLKDIEYLAKLASKKVSYETKFISGLTQNQDRYAAFNPIFRTTNYGKTKTIALANAKKEAEALFLGKSSILLDFMQSIKNK